MRTSLLLGLLFVPTTWAATLPVTFTQQPTAKDVALGQAQSLHYTIANQLKNHAVPIKSIKVINQGDKQADNSFQLKTTCKAVLAPGGTCSIDIQTKELKEGVTKRLLSIDYDGRAPLTSGISFNSSLADYTVLVYIIGSNLEDDDNSASFNISQMAMVGSSPKLNIVLETGGAKKAGWQTVQRKIVYPNSVQFITDLGKINMGATSTIQSFINWGITQYPAKKYMLVFWNHGGGPNGGYGDRQNPATLKALTKAVQQASLATNTTFELLGFDTCLMGNAEVVSSLYPYTRYFIGSEDLEPGKGWSYNTFLNYIVKNPQTNGLNLGKVIVDGFTAQNKGDSTTLSVIDSSKVPALNDALSSFALASQQYITDVSTWKEFAFKRLDAPDYSTSVWDKDSYDLVDLVTFASKVKTIPNLNAVATNLENAVRQAVRYFKNSPNRNPSSWGLTVYFPSIMAEYVTTYPNSMDNFSVPYTDFVTNYHLFYNNNKNALVTHFTSINPDATGYVGEVDGGADMLYAGVGRSNCHQTLPCIATIQENVNRTGNQVIFSESTYDSQWPMLNGTPILLIPNDDDTFLVPVKLADSDDVGYLDVLKTGNTYSVRGFQQSAGGPNTAQGKLSPISPDDKFHPRVYVMDGADWRLESYDNITLTSPFTITQNSLTSINDLNEFRFLAEDVTGALVHSAAAAFPRT